MLKFKRTTLTINNKETKGYEVTGLDNSIFRGLRVALVKNWGWTAYEATTGLSITPKVGRAGFPIKPVKASYRLLPTLYQMLLNQVGRISKRA